MTTWIQHYVTQKNYELWNVGPLKIDSSWWSVLTKRGAVEEGMENDFSIHALRTHEQYENSKRYDIER